ncbi:MAG: glycosyltransferase family 4 protein [Patescibacteria group bacterium]|nr:glycosyltransferase family 4 protein [Patescibacteria group bacterium]MDE2101353.1 glycosyltransferase family 4 protein [Patescibacteria group bacterium]
MQSNKESKQERSIRLLIQNPASLGFGGGHVQALMYRKYLKQLGLDIDFVDFTDSKDDFDILHILGMQAGNCLNGINARKRGKKIVLSSIFYTEANIPVYKLVSKIMGSGPLNFSQNRFSLMQRLVDASDSILPNSNAEAEQLKRIFKIDESKVMVVRNGIEPELFKGVDKNLFVNKFKIASGFVLSVANINRRKNTLNLIKAFLESGLNTTLVLIGSFNYEADAGYCADVKEIIGKSEGRILHLENLHYGDEVLLSAYLNAKVHVLASILETPGLANLEAGLAGCNLVVGDCDPVREYFNDQVLYCKQSDISDIKNKIISAYNRASDNGLSEFVREKYSWLKIAGDIAGVYDSL